jgi:hypothetical protein
VVANSDPQIHSMLESDKAQICSACCSTRALSHQTPRPIKTETKVFERAHDTM